MKRAHWPFFRPFFLYGPLSVGLLVWAGTQAPFSPAWGLLIFASGLVGWTVLEYTLHRWVFHPRHAFADSSVHRRLESPAKNYPLLASSHLTHHDDPQDLELLFARFGTSIPVSLLIFLLLWVIFRQWQGAAIAMAGLWTGYLFYEFVHYSAHFRAPKTRWMQYLKKYHLLHHYQNAQIRFGVSTPWVDWLMGTYRPIVPLRKQEPLW